MACHISTRLAPGFKRVLWKAFKTQRKAFYPVMTKRHGATSVLGLRLRLSRLNLYFLIHMAISNTFGCRASFDMY